MTYENKETPPGRGVDALVESAVSREASRIIESEADKEFSVFGQYLETNHWAEKARAILRGNVAT